MDIKNLKPGQGVVFGMAMDISDINAKADELLAEARATSIEAKKAEMPDPVSVYEKWNKSAPKAEAAKRQQSRQAKAKTLSDLVGPAYAK